MLNKKNEERRGSTLEAATAFLEDLANIRSVLAKLDPTPGDVRRLSAQLRRILVEKDIVNVAAPRIGRIHLSAPDLKPVYISNRKDPIPFFAAAGVPLFGVTVAAALVERAGKPRELLGYSPDSRIPLRVDSFLTQDVICFEGQWVRRINVLKYVANIAHGIHSGKITESTERLIKRVRHVCAMSFTNGMATMSTNMNAFSAVDLPAVVDRKSVDFVLVEVFATAAHLVDSTEVKKLEMSIQEEIK